MSENINETVDELAQDVAAEVEEDSLDLTATLKKKKIKINWGDKNTSVYTQDTRKGAIDT